MSVTQNDPNTIYLGPLQGGRTIINDKACSEAITPGMGVELFNNGGIIRFRKATAALAGALVATEASMLNKGVDDAYAANDLIEVSALEKGSTAWMLIASGQNIAAGNQLEHAGDGTLRILASGVPVFTAQENKPNVTAQTRIRVEAI